MIDWPIDPQKTALINVDLQNIFVDGFVDSSVGSKVVQRLNKLSKVCRSAGIIVIHTAQETRTDGANRGIADQIIRSYMDSYRKSVRAVNDGGITSGSKSAELSPLLDIHPDDIILVKPRYGAFTGTDLDLILRSNSIDAVIIGGIATNVCCETTAREANMRDYKVFFLSDGTANHGLEDLSPGDVKKATLATLRFAFAQILSVDEVIEKIKASADN